MKVMIYIISLCNKIHGGEIYMFQNERFCTCGVNKEVPIVLQCMMSVSYTHLDVYKRQHCGWICIAERYWSC